MQRKKLCKVKQGEMVSGVCMGFSHYFDIEVTLIRLIFVAALFFGFGSPILLYIVLAIVMPTGDPNEVAYTVVEDDEEEEDEDDYYDPSRRRGYEEEGTEAYGYDDGKKSSDERY